MTVTDLVFCEPPSQRDTWTRRLLPLLDRPGEWARVAVYARSDRAYTAAKDLRRGRCPLTHEGRWDFVARGCDDRSGWGVWARYDA